jgi:hypothetical protein
MDGDFEYPPVDVDKIPASLKRRMAPTARREESLVAEFLVEVRVRLLLNQTGLNVTGIIK